jgi:hypothetical protein
MAFIWREQWATETAEGGMVISYHNESYVTATKDGSHMRQTLPIADNAQFTAAGEIDEIVQLCRKNIVQPFRVIQGPDKTNHSQSSYPDYLIDPYIHDDERIYGIGISRYIKTDSRIFNFTNYNEKPEKLRVRLESEQMPRVFIPETGEIFNVGEAVKRDNGFEFDLAIPANRAVFVVCTKKGGTYI